MSRKKRRKKAVQEEGLSENPFDEVAELLGLNSQPEEAETGPETEEETAKPPSSPVKLSRRDRNKNTTRGRIDITRQTAHRGGSAVTVASGFKGIGLPEKKELARRIQKACGVGGTVKDGCIEIQGDNRETMMRILTEAGFNPVLAGG
ncbi:MAG: translation initiation factor [Verrucomicrobiales bacterium]|nr:translation initiation factor [Verrucomicrobiales bacterium]